MKDEIIDIVKSEMLNYLNTQQMSRLNKVLEHALLDVTLSIEENKPAPSIYSNEELLSNFLDAKNLEGCSPKTIKYYRGAINKLLSTINKSAATITTDDLRKYLSDYQKINNCSKSNLDNIRRILSSFFMWLENENYILKSPVRRIHKIRTTKPVKETIADESMEIMRDNAAHPRDLAIIDMLASTGMRVGELRKQADIARELGIPLGTVKWHLFEAKKELKRGMDTMRKASELKFNPIKFHSYGINGSVGKKSPDEFFRSTLAQNICYCVRNTAKTINEIADDLGVSPVYVETEVEFLEEYGFLQAQKDKYIAGFIISEPTAELLTMQNDMYKRTAELFANDLYDELTSSGILDDPDILCGQTDAPISLTESPKADRNFILWTLIPYIAAWSGEKLMDESISFEEVATIRPDGAHNIYHASVVPDEMVLPEDYVYMRNWCGPMWNGNGERILWQIDSEWSERGDGYRLKYSEESKRILSLYEREFEDRLSKDEYAWLAERGCVKTNGDYDGHFKSAWQIVVLANKDIQNKLLAIGERIKAKYQTDFDALKAPYAEAVLESVPAHLRKVKEYELQFVFHADGWFLVHCITTLLKNGKLKEPTEGQRKSLTTLIANV